MADIPRPMNVEEMTLMMAMQLHPKDQKMTIAERAYYTSVLGYYELEYKRRTIEVESDIVLLELSLEDIRNGVDKDSGGDTQ